MPRSKPTQKPFYDRDFNAVPIYVAFLAVFLATGLVIGSLVAATKSTGGINYTITTVPGWFFNQIPKKAIIFWIFFLSRYQCESAD